MIQIDYTERLRSTLPGGLVGVMALADVSGAPTAALDAKKREIETELRTKYAGFSRGDFLALETMQAYERYYKKFDKTYHVQLQLESVVLKGKNFPNVHPLVDAYFMAELQTLVLTAGHNLDTIEAPLRIDLTQEGDEIVQMNGTTKKVRPGDMMMADAEGIISTILYGQDQRTPIKEPTSRALYVAYAPPGVGEAVVRRQFELLTEYVRLTAPAAAVESLEILG